MQKEREIENVNKKAQKLKDENDFKSKQIT